jgi:predicted MFS family arabinose efflux permease
MDLNDLLDERVSFGLGSQLQILYICFLYCMCSCFLTENGVVITAMRNEGQLDVDEATVLETLISLGAVVGAVVYSYCSLRLNRLQLLNYSAMAVLALNYFSVFSDNYYFFIVLRTLQSVLIQNI